jgi:hypothetical protein
VNSLSKQERRGVRKDEGSDDEGRNNNAREQQTRKREKIGRTTGVWIAK